MEISFLADISVTTEWNKQIKSTKFKILKFLSDDNPTTITYDV